MTISESFLKTRPACHSPKCTGLLAVIALTLVAPAGCLADQPTGAGPALRIVAPADRARVAPGDRVNVRLESASGRAFSAIVIAGERPIGMTITRAALPANVPIQIPASIPAGIYHLTALARASSGEVVSSPPVTVDVERSTLPQSLRLEPQGLMFRAIGEMLPLRAEALFAGVRVDVTRSPQMEYSALDSNVATVNPQGQVIAAGAGSTEITARYHDGPRATVTVHVAAPAAIVSPTTIRFDAQPIGASSASRTVTLANRGGEALEITAVKAGGEFAVNEDCLHSSPLPVGGTCYITVTFTPVKAGPRVGAVTISNRATTAATVVHLEGEGKVSP